MPKLFVEQLPFAVSLEKNRTDGFYADLNADKSVSALYDYQNGQCVYEAHLDDSYQSGTATDHFVFADTGYLDGWTDFDGSPSMDTEKRDGLPETQQEQIGRYEEFVDWVKQTIFTRFALKNKLREHHCNFCGKSNTEVERLIAGPDVSICNECVGFCNEVLAS